MKESETVLMHPFRSIQQRNLTVFMTPEVDKNHLDCHVVAIYSPVIAMSLPINIAVEGIYLVTKLCTLTNAVFIMK